MRPLMLLRGTSLSLSPSLSFSLSPQSSRPGLFSFHSLFLSPLFCHEDLPGPLQGGLSRLSRSPGSFPLQLGRARNGGKGLDIRVWRAALARVCARGGFLFPFHYVCLPAAYLSFFRRSLPRAWIAPRRSI